MKVQQLMSRASSKEGRADKKSKNHKKTEDHQVIYANVKKEKDNNEETNAAISKGRD